MATPLILIADTAALILLFTALGSAPVVFLMWRSSSRIVAAPIVGFAVSACLLTTCSRFVALGVAVWAVLVPAAVVSVTVAFAAILRAEPAPRWRQIVPPIVAASIAAVTALLPPLIHRTQGPFSLAIFDAWGYAASSTWLQHHATTAALSAAVAHPDMTLVVGHGFASGNMRIGVDSVVAASASLFGVDTAAAISVVLASLFSLVPLAVWVVTRALKLSYAASCLALALSVTPALLTMVEDTALANLGGVVIVPVLLLFLIRTINESLLRDIAMAGLFLGALLAVFPEFFPPLLVVVLVDVAVLAVVRRPPATAQWFGTTAVRLMAVGALATALAPYAVFRAASYLSALGHQDWPLPARGLTVLNAGAWAFGLLHLYELPFFDSLSPLRMTFALYFPAVLLLVILAGLRRRPVDAVIFVFVPAAVAIAFGLYVYQRYQGAHCQYCMWKALTEMIPFLGIGIGIGVDRLGLNLRGGRGLLLQLPVVIIALLAVVAVGRADARLVRKTDREGAFYPQQLRTPSSAIDRIQKGELVMIEGTNAMESPTETPPFMLPAAYYGVQSRGLEVSFDAVQPAAAYLGVGPDTTSYYSPDYQYVLSSFGGVESNRTVLGGYGPFTLARRAPIDVVLSTSEPSLEPGGPPIPSFTAPFDLRISSSRPGPAALTLTLGKRAHGATVAFARGGQDLPTRVSPGGKTVCAEVRLRRGSTIVHATPLAPLGLTPPRQLGLVAIRGVYAARGRCDEPLAELFGFGGGWYPTEVGPDGKPFRWMSGTATIWLGAARSDRPALRFRADVTSFRVPRRLVVRLGDRRLATLGVPTGRTARLDVAIPRGAGRAQLTLAADPPPLAASVVSPGDVRLVSLAISDARISRVRNTQRRASR
jgi:hypothetical protein